MPEEPLFTSALEQIVFWVILALYFLAAVIWIARSQKRRGKRRRDFVPLTLVAILIAVPIGYARIGALPHWLFYPGEALFAIGGAFTAWSYSFLGRYLSPYVEVLPDHKVIDTGPYRLIRHPGYLGALVALTALGVALQSWVAILLLALTAIGALAHRIRTEERVMLEELGGDYVAYAGRTKRLVPFIW